MVGLVDVNLDLSTLSPASSWLLILLIVIRILLITGSVHPRIVVVVLVVPSTCTHTSHSLSRLHLLAFLGLHNQAESRAAAKEAEPEHNCPERIGCLVTALTVIIVVAIGTSICLIVPVAVVCTTRHLLIINHQPGGFWVLGARGRNY